MATVGDHGQRGERRAGGPERRGYTTDEDTALTVGAPGVLGNDTDVDAGTLTAILVSGPANGTLTLNANGQLHLHAGRELQRAGQLHLQGERRDRGLERRDGHDHGDGGERRAGGGRTTATARTKTRR